MDSLNSVEILKNHTTVVLPGDVVAKLPQIQDGGSSENLVVLGPGLLNKNNLVVATKPGIFKVRDGNCLWIETVQKRYSPVMHEKVVGIIVDKSRENYKVDIGSSSYALLYELAFEGATKRNKPMLNPGDLVYALIVSESSAPEPRLSCIEETTNLSNGLGPLQGGFLFRVTLSLARSLLSADNRLLSTLGELLAFELTVGTNGRVWIKAQRTLEILSLVNVISTSEFVSPAAIEQHIIDAVGKFKKSSHKN